VSQLFFGFFGVGGVIKGVQSIFFLHAIAIFFMLSSFAFLHIGQSITIKWVIKKKTNLMLLICFAILYMLIALQLKNGVWYCFAYVLISIIIIFAFLEFLLFLFSKCGFSLKFLHLIEKLKEYKKIVIYFLFSSTLFQIKLNILYYFFPQCGFLISLLLFFYLLYMGFTKKIHPIFIILSFFTFIFINIIFMDNINNNNKNDINNSSIKSNYFVAYSPVEGYHPDDDYETAVDKFFADKVALAVKYHQLENFDRPYSRFDDRALVPASQNPDGTFKQKFLFLAQNSNVYNCHFNFNNTTILGSSDIYPLHPDNNFRNHYGVARGYMTLDGSGSIPIKFSPELGAVVKTWYDFQFKCNENGEISTQLICLGNQDPPSIAQRGVCS
jgi:hypothetical protein